MMKRNFIYILSIICMAMMTSCLEETPGFAPANPGDEVVFSLNLGSNVHTKTSYGVDNGLNVKVNWVSDDVIAVYGVDCATGRNQAEYKVTPSSSDPSVASAIAKLDSYVAGVQWGSKPSEFYAFYPSNGENTFSTDNGVVAAATIHSQQTSLFELKTNDGVRRWVGTPLAHDDRAKVTMLDNIMYAYAPIPKGTNLPGYKVNLKFHPLASVLKLTLGGWYNNTGDSGQNTNVTPIDDMQITEVVLTAPESIKLAGNFNIQLVQDKSSVLYKTIENSSNSIKLLPILENGKFITIGENEPIEFSLFIIPPTDGTSIDGNWQLTLQTNHGTFVYIFDYSSNDTSIITEIKPGQIHKIDIPAIPLTANGSGGISGGSKDNWITRVDPTIYLSELSLPGAWYCYESDYQGTVSIGDLYDAGVRAFHIDCRAAGRTQKLYCAGTEGYNWGITGTTVEDKLKEIASYQKNKKGEYVVVVMTVAEAAYGHVLVSNKTVAPDVILNHINQILTNNADTLNLYTTKITSKTTVEDVLDHMIVKVNINAADSKFKEYDYVPSTLISTASLAPSNSRDIVAADFIEMDNKKMYWGKTETDIDYYFVQAQKTRTRDYNSNNYPNNNQDFPTISQREEAVNDILSEAYQQYQDKATAKWFQTAIGGFYQNTDGEGDGSGHKDIAKTLNQHVYNDVLIKLQPDGHPSPLGIVLMNYCKNPEGTDPENTLYGEELIDAILKLNDSFKMKRASEQQVAMSSLESSLKQNVGMESIVDSTGSQTGWMREKPLNAK